MSYSIIYKKVVVEGLNGRKYPLIQIGSNNCYEYSEKRAKDWCIPVNFINYSMEDAKKCIKDLLVKNCVKIDDKNDEWLNMDSQWYLSIKNWTKGTMKSLINSISKTTHNFKDFADLRLRYTLWSSYDNHYITLKELDQQSDDFYKGKIYYFYISDGDMDKLLEITKK